MAHWLIVKVIKSMYTSLYDSTPSWTEKIDGEFSWSYLCNKYLPIQERVTQTTKFASFDNQYLCIVWV